MIKRNMRKAIGRQPVPLAYDVISFENMFKISQVAEFSSLADIMMSGDHIDMPPPDIPMTEKFDGFALLGMDASFTGVLWNGADDFCFPFAKIVKFLIYGRQEATSMFARVFIKQFDEAVLA